MKSISLSFCNLEADRQLKMVERKIRNATLRSGCTATLPVGVSKDSAEVWGDKYLYMQGSGAGAPPDNYFPTGQKWMLGAFNRLSSRNAATSRLSAFAGEYALCRRGQNATM